VKKVQFAIEPYAPLKSLSRLLVYSRLDVYYSRIIISTFL